MGLITGILGLPLAPLRGTVAVAEQMRKQAEEEFYDPAASGSSSRRSTGSARPAAISDEDAHGVGGRARRAADGGPRPTEGGVSMATRSPSGSAAKKSATKKSTTKRSAPRSTDGSSEEDSQEEAPRRRPRRGPRHPSARPRPRSPPSAARQLLELTGKRPRA